MTQDRLITVAIHTYDKALELRAMLEAEGIQVTFQNVNLQTPVVSSGVRVRINESNLPLALRIIENPHVFSSADKQTRKIPITYLFLWISAITHSEQHAKLL